MMDELSVMVAPIGEHLDEDMANWKTKCEKYDQDNQVLNIYLSNLVILPDQPIF